MAVEAPKYLNELQFDFIFIASRHRYAGCWIVTNVHAVMPLFRLMHNRDAMTWQVPISSISPAAAAAAPM
jgi:hypothetical protein